MLYQVEWVPTDAFIALAKERGMPEGDEYPRDYAEPDDAARYAQTSEFGKAVMIAKSKLPCDFFGCVRIDRLVKIESRVLGDRDEADAVWHVWDGADALDADEPHDRPDILLYEDEEIVG